jgi:PAS domain S-box-containing protein
MAEQPPAPATRGFIDLSVPPRSGWLVGYGLALLVLAAALGLKVAFLDSLSRSQPYVLFYAAVAVAAWFGGWGPSLVVTLLATLSVEVFWSQPPDNPAAVSAAVTRRELFIIEAFLIGLICARLRVLAGVDGPRPPAERYKHLLEAIRDYAVFQLDKNGRVTTWTATAARILACTESEAVGRPYEDFFTPEDRAAGAPATELREADTAGRCERTGWRVRCDGTKFWGEVVITCGGDGPGYAVVLRDASAKHQAEETVRQTDEQTRQAQRLEAVGRLAGGIAHDFNNLLTIILGNLDLILEHGAPAESHAGLLEDVRGAGKRAAVLTRQLLAFSRREQTVPQRIDLNSVVSDMGSMLRRVIAEHITLTTELRPGLGPVLADPGQIEQVVLNLVVNARDAMPKGGTLTIRTAERDVVGRELPADAESLPGRYVVLAVSDTGHGMDADTKARIFEPFFTTKDVGKGTGLGLATVYGIVKQAKGWVSVDSRPGAGATFRVFLPRAEGEAESASHSADAPTRGGTETVLLVEDEQALKDLAKRALESAGYTVLACVDGRAAIEASRHYTGPIDLLVTDLVMPLMNGRHLAALLRQERPAMKVMLMSGYTDSILVNLSGPVPGEEMLDKPFVPSELTRKVRDMLDRK